MLKKRNYLIDVLKGYAIILVVYGHSIQFLMSKNQDFFENPVFKIIYSFHMPLFMLISGYLFYFSISNRINFREVFFRKIKQLLIPILSWCILVFIIKEILKFILNGISLNILFKDLFIFLGGITNQFWFLWTVLFSSLIVLLINKFTKNIELMYFISFILLLFLPDISNLMYLKFMYPYYIAGITYNKYKENINKEKKLIYIAIIIFLLLIPLYTKECYIYISGMNLYVINISHKLMIILYRYIIGLTGSITFIYLINKIRFLNNVRIINYLGKYTLQIYIIQTYIFEVIKKLSIPPINMYIYLLIITPICTMVILSFCVLVSNIINRRKFLDRFLFGGR